MSRISVVHLSETGGGVKEGWHRNKKAFLWSHWFYMFICTNASDTSGIYHFCIILNTMWNNGCEAETSAAVNDCGLRDARHFCLLSFSFSSRVGGAQTNEGTDLTLGCHLRDSCQIYTTWTDDATCPSRMCQEERLLEGHQETPGHISDVSSDNSMFHLQRLLILQTQADALWRSGNRLQRFSAKSFFWQCWLREVFK